MAAFRVLLVVLFSCMFVYTAIVVANHGFGLLGVFFGDIIAMGWPGQFNVDFSSYLTLSALWLAWRHHFSPAGIALAIAGFFGGLVDFRDNSMGAHILPHEPDQLCLGLFLSNNIGLINASTVGEVHRVTVA